MFEHRGNGGRAVFHLPDELESLRKMFVAKESLLPLSMYYDILSVSYAGMKAEGNGMTKVDNSELDGKDLKC